MTGKGVDGWRLLGASETAEHHRVVPLPPRSKPGREGGKALSTVDRHLALFYSSQRTLDALEALTGSGSFRLQAFSLSSFSTRSWRRRGLVDAVIVEPGEDDVRPVQKIIRWLRRNLPGTPIIAYGPTRLAAQLTGTSLHIAEIPSAEALLVMVDDLRGHLSAARKSSSLARRLRETTRRLQILSDIVSTANSELEPKRVIEVIMSHIQKLIPSEAWSILLVDEKRNELTFEMALGEKGEDFSDIKLKIGEGVAGWVAETGEPAIVNDVSTDSRFQGRYDEQTHFRTRSILCAPLVSRGKTIGVVEILNRTAPTRFSKRDLNLLLTLVEPAAIALENAILFKRTEKLAITDDLTKLYNSHYLSRSLESELKRSAEEKASLSIIFFDLDGFKEVNDEHGHLCGSRTLFEVGSILRKSVREEDIVSRYGGDEFVVVLPGTDVPGAAAIARRIRSSLKQHQFLKKFGLSVHLSASFGVSNFPDHGSDAHALIQKADQAMYRVKQTGKDAVAVAR